jgi:hypothetical protein
VNVFGRLPDRLQPALDGFRDVVASIERAKEALTDAVPTTRLPGRPLAEALLAFDEALCAADASMPDWRVDELEEQWRSCSRAIAASRREAERLRLRPDGPAGFEELIGAIDDVLAPLDAFRAAADRFRVVARRNRRRTARPVGFGSRRGPTSGSPSG